MSDSVVPNADDFAVSDDAMLQFMLLAGKLKTTLRTGWTRYAIPRPESVADHTYRAALLGMFLAPQFGADPGKVAQMLLLHDLGEAIIGDVVIDRGAVDLPNIHQKHQEERVAMVDLLAMIGADHYIDLYDEYAAGETPEASLARQMDRFEMGLQAREYELAHHVDLDEFYVSTERRLRDPRLHRLLAKIRSYRGSARPKL
ncbi:MAG TPA: HD domain-containing protein [Candidatus Saccharimonadales bacterium]|nr:HD domain-containing protein [Candidatus Saccharimonadales bacterium]